MFRKVKDGCVMETKVIDPNYEKMMTDSVLKFRKIYFNDRVDEISVTKVMYYLDKLEAIDRLEGEKRKITLVMNSPGGYVYDGLMLVSRLEEMILNGYEIETITGGMSASMSFVIGLCGSKRKCYKYSSFLAHQPSGGEVGTLIERERGVEESRRLWNVLRDIIKSHSKITDEDLDKIYSTVNDRIYNAEEALIYGIVDEII